MGSYFYFIEHEKDVQHKLQQWKRVAVYFILTFISIMVASIQGNDFLLFQVL